jgi:hypothetical protein
MPETLITHIGPDDERRSVIAECMEAYGVGIPSADWPNNIISQRAVVYGSGRVAREGEAVRHAVDPDELGLCRRLADEAAAVTEGTEVGMGSESQDPFRPFFVVANADEPPVARIDETLIRRLFGGTIFPPATITVEPLAESGVWWSEVLAYLGDSPDPSALRPWRQLIAHFRGRPDYVDSAFVRIGDYGALNELEAAQMPKGTEVVGCVLPRIAIGLTRRGSVAGVFGYTVQT